jgi:hypothetical protein
LFSFLQRTDVDGANGDHGAVGLVEEAIGFLQVVRIREDLVADEDVLFDEGSAPRFHPKADLKR